MGLPGAPRTPGVAPHEIAVVPAERGARSEQVGVVKGHPRRADAAHREAGHVRAEEVGAVVRAHPIDHGHHVVLALLAVARVAEAPRRHEDRVGLGQGREVTLGVAAALGLVVEPDEDRQHAVGAAVQPVEPDDHRQRRVGAVGGRHVDRVLLQGPVERRAVGATDGAAQGEVGVTPRAQLVEQREQQRGLGVEVHGVPVARRGQPRESLRGALDRPHRVLAHRPRGAAARRGGRGWRDAEGGIQRGELRPGPSQRAHRERARGDVDRATAPRPRAPGALRRTVGASRPPRRAATRSAPASGTSLRAPIRR